MYGIVAAAEYEDFIFYSHPIKNGLYKMDKRNNEISFITTFDWESFEVQKLHNRAICIGKTILFFPSNAIKTAIYDIEENILTKFECEFLFNSKIHCHVLLDNESAILFAKRNGVYTFNRITIKNKIVNSESEIELKKIFYSEGLDVNNWLGIKCISVNNQIFHVSGSDNKILSYNIESKKYSIFSIDGGILSAIINADNEGKLWFAFRDTNGIGCFDINMKTYTVFCNYPEDFQCKKNKQPFLSLHFVKDYIIFIPASSNSIITLNRKTYKISILKKVVDIIKDFDENREYHPFSYSYETNEFIVVLFNNRNGAAFINKYDFSINCINAFEGMDDADRRNLKEIINAKTIVKECKAYTLNSFVRTMI